MSWSTVTITALQDAWQGFVNFTPYLALAIIVFIIGWFIALGIGRLIAEILIRLKFNKLFEKTGWREALEKAELKVNPSEFVGAICKWILVIISLMLAADILGLDAFAIWLGKIVGWLPNLIVAIAIFVVAIIVADILEKIVKATVRKIEVKYADFLGTTTRWAVYVFAGFAILLQFEIAETIINALIIGFVGMIALALGLAFGLGGKDAAAKLIEELKEKISEK